MATVTVYTAERMQEIEDSSIVDGNVVGDDLILSRRDGSTINAGSVRGPQGIAGPAYPNGVDTIADQNIDGVKTFIQPIRAGAGSSAAPSYSFSGTPGMGMYRPAAGVLGFAVPAAGWFSFRNAAGGEIAKISDAGDLLAYHGDFRARGYDEFVKTAKNSAGTQIYGIYADGAGDGVMELKNHLNVPSFAVDGSGKIYARGQDQYFGAYAAGGATAGDRLHVNAGSTPGGGVALQAESSGADVDMYFKQKGTGFFHWQNGGGQTIWSLLAHATAASRTFNSYTAQFNVHGQNTAQTPFYVNALSGHSTAIADLAVNNVVLTRFFYDGRLLLNRTSAGRSLEVSSSAASMQDASIYIDRATTAGAQSIHFGRGVSYGMMIGRLGGEDTLKFHRWGGSIIELLAELNVNGGFSAVGTDHKFGPNAFGSAGAVMHMLADSGGTYAALYAESNAANTDFLIRTKGGGSFKVQDSSGNGLMHVDSTGQVQAKGAGHWFGPGAFGAAGKRMHFDDNSNAMRMLAESQNGSIFYMHLVGSTIRLSTADTGDGSGNQFKIVPIAGNNLTNMQISFRDNAGVDSYTTTVQVAATSGALPGGGAGRVLYV